MPADIEQKIRAAAQILDGIEVRLGWIEEHIKLQDTLAAQVRDLRHDFNNARSTVNLLLEELDQRLPIRTKTKQ